MGTGGGLRGEVRSGAVVWLLSIATCGLYGLYWWHVVGTELREYLVDEEVEPLLDIVITLVCFLYALYLPIKYGDLIHRAQQRAGMVGAQDQSGKFFLYQLCCFGFGYFAMQEELNQAWFAAAPPVVEVVG